MKLLMLIMRVAIAQRMISTAKAAAHRSALAGMMAAIAALAAFFALSLAIVVAVMALSEVMSAILAAGLMAVLFLIIAGVMAAFARRSISRVTQPVPTTPAAPVKPVIALSPQTIELLVASGVAIILGVLAGRANHKKSGRE